MQKRVIDNQFVLMTDDEYKMYQEICKSYDRPPSVKGADLFVGLVVSDNEGYITFIKPPSQRQTSLECYLFIASVFQHQQMRLMQKQVDDLCANIKLQAEKLFEEIKSDTKKLIKNKDVADKPDSK
jgi:hypothetical protein